jgi:hypothetical protein
MKRRLLFLFLALLAACDKKARINNSIQGSWTLQKVLTTQKQFDVKSGTENYLFRNDGTYRCKSFGFDVVLDEQGYYEIWDEYYGKSGFFLILKGKVEPNSYGDTIRQHSMFEILTLTKDSLVVGTQMEFIYDSFPNQWFNRKEFYTSVR